MLWIVEDGLDEGLKGGIVRLEVVDILLVDSFPAMIRIGIVDTFGTVDGSTGSTTRGISIALNVHDTISTSV